MQWLAIAALGSLQSSPLNRLLLQPDGQLRAVEVRDLCQGFAG
jgi:hypothetical protein